jgi:hypothetical protein
MIESTGTELELTKTAKLPGSPLDIIDRALVHSLLVTLLFFLIGFFGIAHHEMWTDETQAWLIAKDSANLQQLFENIRSERHPGLWHLCLFLISRFTHAPAAMQLFHLLIASATTFLIARFAPFKVWVKIPLIFSYFFAYEYAVISRCYAPGIFLIFLFLALNQRKSTFSFWAMTIVLCLLSNTNVFGLMIAVSLVVYVVGNELHSNGISHRLLKLRVVVAAMLFSAAVSLSIFQLIRVTEGVEGYEGWTKRPAVSRSRMIATSNMIWRSYVPFPNLSSKNFWNSCILMQTPWDDSIFTKLSPLVVLCWIVLLRKRPAALLFYMLATSSILCFSYARYIGNARHVGHLFVVLVVACWLYHCASESRGGNGLFLALSRRLSPCLSPLLALILSLHVAAAIYAYFMDFKFPFSSAKGMAKFISGRGLSNLPITGFLDIDVSPIAAYLDKQIYYPNQHKLGSFMQWKSRPKTKRMSSRMALTQMSEFLSQQKSCCLIILTDPLQLPVPRFNLQFLHATYGSLDWSQESYYLYLFRPASTKDNSSQY